MKSEVIIRGGSGGLVEVGRGETLEIINESGRQICDFFAFNPNNMGESLSPAHTRTMLDRVVLQTGDLILSKYRRPMFEILEDTYGCHDITQSACDPIVYEQRFGKAEHRSCRTNLAEAVAGRNLPYECLPDPFNFFQDTPLQPDGHYRDSTSGAKKGDRVVLKATVDVLAVGSACPFDAEVTGENPTNIRFVVWG